jgi:plastocyanin
MQANLLPLVKGLIMWRGPLEWSILNIEHLPMTINLSARTICSNSSLLLLLLSTRLFAADISITLKDTKQRSVHDTIVELVGARPELKVDENIEIAQVDKEFYPEIMVIPEKSPVLFTNHDLFQHHVYSVSKGNQFDLPLYQGTPSKHITFSTPGIVKLGCNIHDWMLAFGYVSQSKHLIISDASGKVHFSGIPDGEYELRIWNPRLKNNKTVITQAVELKHELPLEKTITLSLRKRIRKPPRVEKNSDY